MRLPLLLAVALIVSTLLPPAPALARDPKLKVVTTVAPHADLIREIAGDRVDLVQLIPDGTDSHTFEPRPSDAAVLHSAHLIVLNGLHLQAPTQRMAHANKLPDNPSPLLGGAHIAAADHFFAFPFP